MACQKWGYKAGYEQWPKLHLYSKPLPITHIASAPLPIRSALALSSQGSKNPTVNSACKRSRLHISYENLMPNDLRWSWGDDASIGSGCGLTLAESFDCTDTLIIQLLTDSFQNTISMRQVTIEMHLVVGFLMAHELVYFTCIAASVGRL